MSPTSARRHSATVLRLALKTILTILIISACSSPDRQAVDKLNAISYAYHYRNLDSVQYYAAAANGSAEALNNLAFAAIAHMEYQRADSLLAAIPELTDNQLELLVCYVQQMRLCQRRSRNKEFHDFREHALNSMLRIDEERNQLLPHQQQRLRYAESEFAIVNSTYYYYVGLERQSIEALQAIDPNEVRRDTAQYLNYLYNIGAGGIITDGTPEEIYDEEMDYLGRCLSVALRFHYPYFEAQAKEAIAEHTGDTLLAAEALDIFSDYGDIYQIAGAHRTLASCYHAMGYDEVALQHLHLALADTAIYQAPDLVASIREQLSVVYAALNDKPASDHNRNLYLDVQEQTRQDRELEARAAQYDKSSMQLNWMLLAVLAAILMLVFLLWLFNRQNRLQQDDHRLDDVLEQKTDELRCRHLSVEKSERRHLEQRAKISLVNSITPFIDRILHEVKYLDHSEDTAYNERLNYIRELTDMINAQNNLLTQWIQLRQGELSLHIESFPLQPLFDIIARGQKAFAMQGITLQVTSTEAVVKADRVLTLFMLNTLADNARKFTPQGGKVSVSASEADTYIEIAVEDTGQGMSEKQLAHLFDTKTIKDSAHGSSHGFGLMNCRGIIEKYRKTSQIFSVCKIAAESQEGRGSRLFFRLPKGIRRIILLLAMLSPLTSDLSPLHAQDYMSQAHIYADSAYFCNINGDYQRTLLFADSCRACLNAVYRQQRPQGQLLMMREGDTSQTPPEIQWYHDSINVNYQIVLDIRNESAVAALALHEWQLYAYNNKVYTQLFKELSADNTLADYCRMMQQSQVNKRIAMIVLILLLLAIVPAYYMLYYRHRLYARHRRERQQLADIEMTDDELRRTELEENKLHVVNNVLDNCLSTLKHETMYYPSRIRQLVDSGDIASLDEVTRYYRELYGILSEQAMRQLEQVKLHVHRTEYYGHDVLGDDNMLRFLTDILNPSQVDVQQKNDHYLVFTMQCPNAPSDIDYLCCRQILRDIGETTHRRGCGITANGTSVTVTLPAATHK